MGFYNPDVKKLALVAIAILVSLLITFTWQLGIKKYTWLQSTKKSHPIPVQYSIDNIANSWIDGSHHDHKKIVKYIIPVPPKGRLGNQLFNYASTMGIGHTCGLQIAIPRNYTLSPWFQLSATELSPSNYSRLQWIKWPQKLNKCQKSNIRVTGYMQQYAAFIHISERIRTEFTFAQSIQDTVKMFFASNNGTARVQNATYIGIHARMGDMANNSYARKLGYHTAPAKYYHNAMQYYQNKFNASKLIFIVCSNDVAWAKANINGSNVIFSENAKAAEDLAILAHCDHMIMSVGSFGWWAGFLANGTTVHYKDRFRKGSRRDMRFKPEGYFPPEWIAML